MMLITPMPTSVSTRSKVEIDRLVSSVENSSRAMANMRHHHGDPVPPCLAEPIQRQRQIRTHHAISPPTVPCLASLIAWRKRSSSEKRAG